MEEADKWWLMNRKGVSGWMFLLVLAHPGSPGQRAIKWLCVCVTMQIKTAHLHAATKKNLSYSAVMTRPSLLCLLSSTNKTLSWTVKIVTQDKRKTENKYAQVIWEQLHRFAKLSPGRISYGNIVATGRRCPVYYAIATADRHTPCLLYTSDAADE